MGVNGMLNEQLEMLNAAKFEEAILSQSYHFRILFLLLNSASSRDRAFVFYFLSVDVWFSTKKGFFKNVFSSSTFPSPRVLNTLSVVPRAHMPRVSRPRRPSTRICTGRRSRSRGAGRGPVPDPVVVATADQPVLRGRGRDGADQALVARVALE